MALSPKEEAVLQLIKENPAYENYFFKKVSDIKWFIPLKLKDYFLPDKAPKPISSDKEGYFIIPEWNVLPYLARVSTQVNTPGNEGYIDELLSIIREVTHYHISHDKCLDNHRTWWYFVKILLNLPNNKITFEDIELVSVWLDSKFDKTLQGADIAKKLLPKLLDSDSPEDWNKAEKIVEIITDIGWIPLPEGKANVLREKEEPKTMLDGYWLLESFKVNASKIGKKCSNEIVLSLADRLKEIIRRIRADRERDIASDKKQSYQNLNQDYSYIWFRSLFGDPGQVVHSSRKILTLILRDILKAKASTDKEKTTVILNKFLSAEYPYPIFKRMVLFVIGCEWDRYKDLFLNIVDENRDMDLFDDSHYQSELYMVLQININRFSPEEKEKIKTIIEMGPSKYLSEKNQDKYIAYWKQEWYSALKTDPDFASLYKEQLEKTKKQEELTFLKEPEVETGPGPSPLTKEDILRMSNLELAEYFKSFRTKDFWKGPTVGGLAELLGEVAKEDPGRFFEDMNPFMNVEYLYVYEIISGIKGAWNEKRSIDWGKLLSFIRGYINREEYWDNSFVIESPEWSTSRADYEWVVGVIAELIEYGTRDAQWSMPGEYFDEAQEILILILEKLKVGQEVEEDIKDFVTYTINTSLGRAIIALIYLAFRKAKINGKKGIGNEVKWDIEIRDKYNEIVERRLIEGFALFGQYMPTLYYLDREWIRTKLRDFESLKGTKIIEALMDGYLLGNNVYDDLYELMKPYYLYYIDYSFGERHTGERLIHHISIGYLRGHEDIDDTASLFRKVLDLWSPEQVLEIIKFFWMQRTYLDTSSLEHEAIKERIINFWKWVYDNKYRKKKELSEEDKNILAHLARLTVFIDRVDPENINWLMVSARHVDVEFSSPFFIEYLDRFEDEESIRKVGKIFLEMLSIFTPNFDQEHIRSIVKKLYRLEDKTDANKICNIYGSRGHEFLRDLYAGNNP